VKDFSSEKTYHYQTAGIYQLRSGAPQRLIGMYWILPTRQDESRWRTG